MVSATSPSGHEPVTFGGFAIHQQQQNAHVVTSHMFKAHQAIAAAAFLAASSFADSLSIAPDGNFLIDGKSKFLLGTIIYHQPQAKDYRHTDGYPDEYAWIYETPPGRDYLQRLGFDTVGGEVSLTWLSEFRPDAKVWQAHKALDWNIATNWWLSGLPTIVDFTCARWSHGAIQFEEGRKPSRAAIPEGGAGHFLPYSLASDEGRALYARMWRSGAEELKAHGATPYAYELFNEPRCSESSPAARALFAKDLERLFGGDIHAMNKAWGSQYGSFAEAANFRQPYECTGLGVEWLKFMERLFASGISLGAKTIRDVVPGARVCFQPLSIAFGYVNVLEANRECGVVMSPTGGGGFYDSLILRAISDGKPIIDGETYLGHTRASHRAKILLEYARGYNAFYYFKWDRRLDDPAFRTPDGPQRMAETFPYMALNPVATPPEAFSGMLDAKREIAAVEDLFNPRERGIRRDERAAVLFSFPTERLGVAAGHGNHNFAKSAAEAMMEAHLPMDVVFEEQLPEGRLEKYRFLVAAGIDATLPATVPILGKWVEQGGTLVLGQEAMTLDEWARPASETFGIGLGDFVKGAPQAFSLDGIGYEGAPYREIASSHGWSVAASLPDGSPAILKRHIGSGTVYFIAVRLDAREEAHLLANLAFNAGVTPTAHAIDLETGDQVQNLEIHAARGDDDRAFILILHGLAPRAVRFIPGLSFKSDELVNAADGTLLGRDKDGAALLLMEPETPVVLRGRRHGEGYRMARRGWFWRLFHRRPSPDATDAGAKPTAKQVSYESIAAQARQWLDKRRPKTSEKVFSTDPARVRFIDLGAAANRAFTDRIPGDGKGGWTDQGENCLRNAPWGVTDCNGVPFDFIRPDQNNDRACIVLKSSNLPQLPDAVRGIDVNLRAESLYFLHAGAWLSGAIQEAFRYVVHYSDGSSETIPMMPTIDFDDWWIRSRGKAPGTARCRVAWTNSERKGFYALRWDNPYPDKLIASIDIESANTSVSPLIAAITAELPDESPFALWRMKPGPWGHAGVERRHGGLEITASDKTRDWAGAKLTLPEPAALPADADRHAIAFEVNSGENGLGRRDQPPPPFQFKVEAELGDGTRASGRYTGVAVNGGAVDADPDTWQKVEIPLEALLPEGATRITALFVQFKAMPSRPSGLLIRGIGITGQGK